MWEFPGGAEQPADHSEDNSSTVSVVLADLDCPHREGWLVNPLENGARVAVLNTTCKQALTGCCRQLESLNTKQAVRIPPCLTIPDRRTELLQGMPDAPPPPPPAGPPPSALFTSDDLPFYNGIPFRIWSRRECPWQANLWRNVTHSMLVGGVKRVFADSLDNEWQNAIVDVRRRHPECNRPCFLTLDWTIVFLPKSYGRLYRSIE